MENTKKNEDPNCKDTSKACPFWAEKGFCETRRDFMLTDCKLSCNACNKGMDCVTLILLVFTSVGVVILKSHKSNYDLVQIENRSRKRKN